MSRIFLKRAITGVRASHSKAWNKRTTNNWIVQLLIGCGNGTAYKRCDEIDVDPDGHEL